jgi:predicted nucleic acid-binding protein
MIGLDTMVLIYLLKAEASDQPGPRDNEDLFRRAQRFLRKLKSDKGSQLKVAIPAPVLAEFLMGYDESEWDSLEAFFSEHFAIWPLTSQSAKIAARLMRKQSLPGGEQRECVRTDAFIVGIAIEHRADAFYSEDNGVKALGHGEIKVEALPEPEPTPGELFPPNADVPETI